MLILFAVIGYGIYAYALYFDAVSAFQQFGYKRKKWLEWLKIHREKLLIRSVIAILPFIFLSIEKEIFRFDDKGYLVFIYLIIIICLYVHLSTFKIKVKAKFTKRLIRESALALVLFTISGCLTDYVLRLILNNSACYSYLYIFIFPAFLVLSDIIFSPYEKWLYSHYIGRCKKKLCSDSNLIKIGVTGSFGKTSVKEFLAEMLKYDYKVYATPKSYNTPLGICLSVKDMPENCEVFIAEMGAKRLGDVKELADIVQPQMGIITAIGSQHLETFGSLENVKNAKYELIEGLQGDGVAIFSIETPEIKELYDRTKCRKISVGINKGDVYCKDISINGGNTEFVLVIKGKNYAASTKLIGKHNLLNIALAAAAASELGVSGDRIVSAVRRLKPPKHRLEVIETSSGVTVIDDGYNANPEGIRSAAEAIKSFSGKKFAVVAGLVECGEYAEKLNAEAGECLGGAVDMLIAVGVNSDYILSGANKTDCETVAVKNLDDAKSILKSKVMRGDVVIFINDLPDIYESN